MLNMPSVHANFLDAPEELASEALLSHLGVRVGAPLQGEADADFTLQTVESDNTNVWLAEQGREFSSSSKLLFIILSGELFFDVRDSGDHWIRVHVREGQQVELRQGLFHRLIFKNGVPSSYSINSWVNNATYEPRFPKESDGFAVVKRHTHRELVCDLCRQFFVSGWVTGTGGSISIRFGDRIYMTPSGVQKERIEPEDVFVLDLHGNMLSVPTRKPGTLRAPKLSECSPLFLVAFRHRKAGAVLHSHDMSCNIVSAMCEGKSEWRIRKQEMIKGITGHGYLDELVIPIIDNTPHEHELTASLEDAVLKYPKAVGVLVRHHGVYVWGGSWEEAKRHGEVLHYLFEISLKLCHLSMAMESPTALSAAAGMGRTLQDASVSSAPKRARTADSNTVSNASAYKAILLDIEGTTTPITFVKDTMFPFAASHVESYLRRTWGSEVTSQDVEALRAQYLADKKEGIADLPHSKAFDSEVFDPRRTDVLGEAVAYVHWSIAKDRKVRALKDLQGRIWHDGFVSGQLIAQVYEDVPRFLKSMQSAGIPVCIYSSGSRQAQKLLFGHSERGNLRPLLSAYFDTSVGNKRSAESYTEIFNTLNVDIPSDILFVTDIYEEAVAAAQAGLHAVISVRPGNAALPEGNTFKTITSFDQL